jgi:hypothetical protein
MTRTHDAELKTLQGQPLSSFGALACRPDPYRNDAAPGRRLLAEPGRPVTRW